MEIERQQWLSNEIDKLFAKTLEGKKLCPDEIMKLRDYKSELRKLNTQLPIEAQKVKDEKSKEMRRRRKRGKYGEARLAKEVGGRRDGGVGRKDVVAGMFSFEIKTLKKIPASIIKIMMQAERLKKRDTIAVGVFRCNSPRSEYFILERQDWLDLHGGKKK